MMEYAFDHHHSEIDYITWLGIDCIVVPSYTHMRDVLSQQENLETPAGYAGH